MCGVNGNIMSASSHIYYRCIPKLSAKPCYKYSIEYKQELSTLIQYVRKRTKTIIQIHNGLFLFAVYFSLYKQIQFNEYKEKEHGSMGQLVQHL